MILSIDEIKSLLNIDGDEHDEMIGMIIPIQTIYVENIIGKKISELPEEQQEMFKLLVLASVGCYLIKAIPDFGTKRFNYRVGNVSETFMRRYYKDYDDWCDFYNDLITDLSPLFDTGDVGTFKRHGVTDDYRRPY